MKRIPFLAVLIAAGVHGAEPQVIRLWPGAAPGSEHVAYVETHNLSKRDHALNIRNVTRPTLTVYPSASESPARSACVVCPGGGFVNLGYGKEGEEVARWLNSVGMTAFVLKYRLAETGDSNAKIPTELRSRVAAVAPLATEDLRQAVRIVRARAAEWRLNVGHIGAIGFSAGGYLVNCVALKHDAQCRLDFAAAIYSTGPALVEVPSDAPPLFLVHANDDPVGPAIYGSVRIFTAWAKAGKPVELHVYARGGHGFALRRAGLPVDTWNIRLHDWLVSEGFL